MNLSLTWDKYQGTIKAAEKKKNERETGKEGGRDGERERKRKQRSKDRFSWKQWLKIKVWSLRAVIHRERQA